MCSQLFKIISKLRHSPPDNLIIYVRGYIMNHKSLIFLLLLILIFIFNACHIETGTEPVIIEPDGYAYITRDQAIEQSLSMVNGAFDRIEKTAIGEKIFWQVFIITEAGSPLLFEYLIEPGDLWEITGLSPSFNYEFNPSINAMNFNKAKESALIFKPGEIKYWKLRMDKNRQDWEYRFHIMADERLWDVRFNAVNGELIVIG
jgi:hypothetical protein